MKDFISKVKEFGFYRKVMAVFLMFECGIWKDNSGAIKGELEGSGKEGG